MNPTEIRKEIDKIRRWRWWVPAVLIAGMVAMAVWQATHGHPPA